MQQETASSFLGTSPNRILYNARIHTVNPRQPSATAIAITGTRILAVGDDDTVRTLGTASTRQVDMDGATVLPGFIDAHCHVLMSGLMHCSSSTAICAVSQPSRTTCASGPGAPLRASG